MKIKFLGHATFYLEIGDCKVLVDPFIDENPIAEAKAGDFNDIDYIFITHGHGDHIGDTISIARKSKAKVVANPEICSYLRKFDIDIITMQFGSYIKTKFGEVKMVPATHSSSIKVGDDNIYGGLACGYIFKDRESKVYHAGDTGITMEMSLLKDEKIDVALLPVGGHYTMGVQEIDKALELIDPKLFIPMHYNTWDIIKVDIDELKDKYRDKVIVLDIGQEYNT